MMTYELDNKSIARTLLLIAPLSGLMKMWESSGNLQRGPSENNDESLTTWAVPLIYEQRD